MSKQFLLIAFVAFGFIFTGCDKKSGSSEASGDVQKVEISGNDAMQYDKKEIKVKAGKKVELKLTHSGKQTKDVMGHNWILLKDGVAASDFAKAASTAKDTDFIPASMEGDIIAHTKLLGGGESDTITFDAPAPGTYTYLCSFPGHFAMMNGKLIVEP